MSYHAPDHNNIVTLFVKYANSKATMALSLPGFYSYLALKIGYPGWLIKEIKRQVKLDENLNEFVMSAIEGTLVDGMNAGLFKEGAVKFTLKNHHGYVDNPDVDMHSKGAKAKTVVYRAAGPADKQKASNE